jgi:transcriptional regulator with XRE-family HTH domain
MPRFRSEFGPSAAVLAHRIRAERLRLGLTQEQMAAKLGVKRVSYKPLESSANPGLATVIALVLEGGMDARQLVPELFGSGTGLA